MWAFQVSADAQGLCPLASGQGPRFPIGLLLIALCPGRGVTWGPVGLLLTAVRPTSGQPAESHRVSRQVCCPFLHSYEPPLLLLRDQEMRLVSLVRHGVWVFIQGNPHSGGAWGPPTSPTASLSPQAALCSDPCSPTAAHPSSGKPPPGSTWTAVGSSEWPPWHQAVLPGVRPCGPIWQL